MSEYRILEMLTFDILASIQVLVSGDCLPFSVSGVSIKVQSYPSASFASEIAGSVGCPF